MSAAIHMKRIGCCVIAALCGLPIAARAQVRPEAEKLFRDGKELIRKGKIAEACAAFEASEKASHSIATVLSLADCREKNRQYASAWALFLQADSQTRTDASKATLNATARSRAEALELRLSYLTINVPDESRIPGLIVSRDGIEIDPAEWNTAIPIDGGPHEVSGKAPGRESWSTKVTIAPERDRQSVEVPKFKVLAQVVIPPPATPAPEIQKPPEVPRPGPVLPSRPHDPGIELALRIAPGVSGAASDGFASGLETVGSTSFGLEVAYPVHRYLWLMAGATYEPLGTNYKLALDTDVAMMHERLTYLQVPVAVRAETAIRTSGVTLRPFACVGLSLDYAAQRGGTFEMGGGSGSLSDPDLGWYDEHNSLNVGALVGAGVAVGLGARPSIYVGLDVTYEQHLRSEWSGEFFADSANYRYNATRFGLSLRYQWPKSR